MRALSDTLQARALATIELREIALQVLRQRFRNQSPGVSELEIDAQLRAYLVARPGPWGIPPSRPASP